MWAVGDALLPGMDAPLFRTIAMDPPWAERGGGKVKRGADRWYPLLSVDEILTVVRAAPLWRPDPACCSVWMWATQNFLPEALWLMKALGVHYVTGRTWFKTCDDVGEHVAPEGLSKHIMEEILAPPGLGQRFRFLTEHLLLGTIGKVPVPTPDRRVSSAILAPRARHSEKPQCAYDDMETHDGPGSRAELFARDPRPGWEVWGNEIVTDGSA